MAFRLDARGVTDSQVPWPIAVSFLIRPLDESFTVLRATVVLAEFIDGASIDASRVQARTALEPTARRAGWIGASIDLTGLERRVVVGPSLDPERRAWKTALRTNTVN